MSETHIIEVSDLNSLTGSSAEPTCELRRVPRFVPAPLTHFFYLADPVVEMVLQQRWKITDYRGGKPVEVRGEWRDVPTSTE